VGEVQAQLEAERQRLRLVQSVAQGAREETVRARQELAEAAAASEVSPSISSLQHALETAPQTAPACLKGSFARHHCHSIAKSKSIKFDFFLDVKRLLGRVPSIRLHQQGTIFAYTE
jgi:hypothetical protein